MEAMTEDGLDVQFRRFMRLFLSLLMSLPTFWTFVRPWNVMTQLLVIVCIIACSALAWAACETKRKTWKRILSLLIYIVSQGVR